MKGVLFFSVADGEDGMQEAPWADWYEQGISEGHIQSRASVKVS